MVESDDFVDSDPFDPRTIESRQEAAQIETASKDGNAKAQLGRRREAYRRVFSEGNTEQVDIDIVLNDLMYFCKVWVPAYNVKDGEHANVLSRMKDGRREVFLRIKDFSMLDADALLLKYTDATTK